MKKRMNGDEFYKVDSNDKVTRLRRECPHEMCGPGVFMAMHFNRYSDLILKNHVFSLFGAMFLIFLCEK